jgi:hypothetical protein
MGEKHVTLVALDRRVVQRLALQVQLISLDVVIGVGLYPRVIQPSVIRDKIEHKTQTTFFEPLAQTLRRRISPELFMSCIASDGKTRTRDVFFAEVRQCLLNFFAPLRIGARDALP